LPIGQSGRAAFERVYRESFDFVWRILRGMLVPEAQLEDAAQEVFVVVLRRLPDFDGQAAIRTWLYEIAVNVARNQRRSVRRKGGGEQLGEDLAHDGPGPGEIVESRRALSLVMSVLATLDEDQRIIVYLTEIEELSAPQIAELLGANVNTVSARLRRGREAFRAELARRGVGR
jgi:RNA polymerase sigma-70 factor (ECF subfamily)